MSRKKIFILIIAVFILLLSTILYYFTNRNNSSDVTPTSNNNLFGDFFPIDNSVSSTQNTNTPIENNIGAPIEKLRVISNVPIAGAIIFNRPVAANSTTTETVYRYVERATGHIYEMKTSEREAIRISNTTIPKVYEAILFQNKNQIILRYLDRDGKIDTYVAEIKENLEDASEEKNILSGLFMRKNISNIIVSPDEKNIFTINRNTDPAGEFPLVGNQSLMSNPNTERLVFSHYIFDWLTEWINVNYVSFNSKPSFVAPGYLYLLDMKTKSFDKVLGPINGLVSKVSPDAKKIIYSSNNNGVPSLNIIDTTTGENYDSPNLTIADKCVWSNDNVSAYCAIPSYVYYPQLPDMWYQGKVSFNDSLVKINTKSQTSETILNSSDYSTTFDMINLKLSPTEDYIIFTNKKDLRLWSLDLK